MEFDRARNEEQRKIRIEEIKNAAIKLLDTKQFHEIDLTQIANGTSFTRGNLYKYISSKEEIYLLIIVDEINDMINDIKKYIHTGVNNGIDDFSENWAYIMYRHERFIKLISLLFSTLERNVSLQTLINFKKQFGTALYELNGIVKEVFSTWDDKIVNKFIQMQMHYAIGLFQTTSPSQIQKEANEKSGVNYKIEGFIEDFSEFISYTIHYLNNMKTD